MIWLAWRQHRKPLLFTVAGLAVVVALILPTGLAMHKAYKDTGLAECLRTRAATPTRTGSGPIQTCDTIASNFNNRYTSMLFLAILFVILPLLVGLFWGAPLVAREVEHGTHRLVWTQGVSRRRWALAKIAVVGTSALVLASGYALLVAWWLEPIGATAGRLTWLVFDLQGLVPVAYTLFAVALGVLIGTFARRSLPAMAFTLVGFIAARVVVTVLARPNFVTPKERRFPMVGGQGPRLTNNDWILSNGFYRADGTEIMAGSFVTCSDAPPGNELPLRSASPTVPCDVASGYGAGAYNLEVYQPADRFWLFQYIEAGIFAALAVLLIVLAVYRIRRRVS
jgi:hypothetical protein